MIAGVTASGLQPLKWVKRLLHCIEEAGSRSNWLFQKLDGARMTMKDFEIRFYDCLVDIQSRRKDLIAEETDVSDVYFLARSFRRGATTRAQLAKVSEADVNWVNRWGTGTECRVKGPKRVVYSERSLMLNSYLRFSKAL